MNFVGHVGAELLAKVPGVAASTGSACHEGKVSQSPVLCAMGVPPEVGKGAVRLTVGRFTTEEEVDRAAELLDRGRQVAGLLAAETRQSPGGSGEIRGVKPRPAGGYFDAGPALTADDAALVRRCLKGQAAACAS